MKLENVQIKIKNKEHYEAVKKRLQEFGKWTFKEVEKILPTDFRIMIYIYSERLGWNPIILGNNPNLTLITIDDLYEVKKERVIKERFKVYDDTARFLFSCNTHQDALDFIKNQDNGTYEIKKFYK